MKNIRRNKYLKIPEHLVLIILAISAYSFSLNYPCFAEVTSHLANGIKLYHSGNYDEALTEFKAEIEFNKHCPLVYYYAAHIRLAKEQYPRAKQNLEAALRDSMDFHDAHGLLAFTFLQMGESTNALAEWESFVRAIGSIDENTPLTIESIMLPEEFHKILKREARIKELERLETERRERERLRAEKKFEADKTAASGGNIETDSVTASDQRISAILPADNQITEIETPLVDLEERIKSSIRIGIYGIIGVTAILGISVFTAVYWIRKKRVVKEEKNFSEEIERLLGDRKFELDEENALQEFEAKSRKLAQESQSIDETTIPNKNLVVEHPIEETKQTIGEKNIPDSMRKSPITEEIKALVSRLYREGHSAEEIAHTADLTKTEVDLILAVREHHLDNLIDEITREEEDLMNGNQLTHAIHDLCAEGVNTHEIAKKLNISLSEVELASSILEMQKKNYKG